MPPVSGREGCPDCHPERSEGSGEPAEEIQSSRSELALERSEGMTGLLLAKEKPIPRDT